MKLSKSIIALVCMLASMRAALAGGFPGSNDNMFRPPAAARKHIDFSPRGFIVDGKPTFIAAAEVQYPRIPRELWRDRLLRVKRTGYNTIQTYAYWSFHEPKEGQWDFTGAHDFRAFLDLIHSLGMYAIVRVGPYINAEWDTGGMPVWLRFKKDLVVRKPNAAFEAAVDQWYDKIVPLVASEQVTHGGPVIMVQLENEHSDGAGTDVPNDYFKHLQSKALALGIDVPYFFSGVNHGNDPIGDQPLDPDMRQTPWFSSEFWTGWIATYGVDLARSARLIRATWKVIALGGSGFAHYTLVGGTDFDHWACDEQASAYDFGAPIGQQGDFRVDYYPLKRAMYFADSFTDILGSSTNATARYAKASTGAFANVSARASKNGTIVFFDAAGSDHATAQLRLDSGTLVPSKPLALDGGEIVPFVLDRRLSPSIKMDYSAARLLGVARSGHTTTVVAYGSPGESAELKFDLTVHGRTVTWPVSLTIVAQGATEAETTTGTETLRVVAMPTSLADRTWFVDTKAGTLVVMGPDYLGDVSADGKLMHAEYAASTQDILATMLADGDGKPVTYKVATVSKADAYLPRLGPWKSAPGDAEASTAFDDTTWLSSTEPQQMGTDGDVSDYAWYRSSVMSKGGTYGLNFADAGDWLALYINGKFAGETGVERRYAGPIPRGLSVTLQDGKNDIAVFTAHYGRDKLYPWYGPINDIDSKGIRGSVTLSAEPTSTAPVGGWRWIMDDRGEPSATERSTADYHGQGWQDASIGQDVFGGHIGYAWFRTTLPASTSPGHRVVHFTAVDDNATVYLNGQKVATNQGWNVPFDVDLDSAWKSGVPNELAVLAENTAQGGGISQPVSFTTTYAPVAPPITAWKMRGNIGVPAASKWGPLAPSTSGGPRFYKSSFTLPSTFASGRRTALRVSTAGLSRGFVWLNGHNLGRYPELSPVQGIYLPECWLKVGANSVMIFDEDGNAPSQVSIVEETAASRRLVDYRAK